MKIEFFDKESGELVKHQEDFKVDYNGHVWQRDWSCSFHRTTYIYTNLIGWRIVNE